MIRSFLRMANLTVLASCLVPLATIVCSRLHYRVGPFSAKVVVAC